MTGVWIFKDGVMRRVERPTGNVDRKVLVHMPSEEIITSYAVLEEKLTEHGWERYYDNPDLLQYHKTMTRHLISLPPRYSDFRTVYMYDIVVKNRGIFEVRDVID